MNRGPTVIPGRKCPQCGQPMTRYIRAVDPLAGMTNADRQAAQAVIKPEFLLPKEISLFVCKPCNHRQAEEAFG